MDNEKQILLKAIEADPNIIYYANEIMLNDKDFMMKLVQLNGSFLRIATPELQNDKELVIEAVTSVLGSDVLQWASITLKDDKEVILAAVNRNAHSIIHASNRLKLDNTFMSEVIRTSHLSIKDRIE